MGFDIIGDDSFLEKYYQSGVKYAFVTVGSVGNTSVRERLFIKLKKIGFLLPAVIDKSANVSGYADLSEGVYIGRNASVNAGTEIKAMAIINTGAIVEHSCRIGEFAHISPGAVLCGDVTIGKHTHIGANATVKNGIVIGDHSLIGAQSNVVDPLQDHIIAYGNPCRRVGYHG
ncbi:UDP-N-acetylbacillosamine N-acetyltransferase [bioreactor metagenome]|uniref:UDP-N-acetylbacillosamine N-acetyltransferase n=1 Tax=bioreactor metagenome TaxID=1076179 RepID=A0A645F5L8_9ZZZZ